MRAVWWPCAPPQHCKACCRADRHPLSCPAGSDAQVNHGVPYRDVTVSLNDLLLWNKRNHVYHRIHITVSRVFLPSSLLTVQNLAIATV